MKVKIIDELTLFSLKFITQPSANIHDLFLSNKGIFENEFIIENNGFLNVLTSKDKNKHFKIQYSIDFIEIISFDFDCEEILKIIALIINKIGSFEDIILTTETAFGFETINDRNRFFKNQHAVSHLLTDDNSSLFYVKEMLEKDGFRFILSLFQDIAENNEGEDIPVIGCSLQSTMTGNGMFEFDRATKLTSELMRDVVLKLSVN